MITSFLSASGPLILLCPGEVLDALPATVAGRAGSEGTFKVGDAVIVEIVRARTGGRGEGDGWVVAAVLVTRTRTGVVVVDVVRERIGETTEPGFVLVVVAFLSDTAREELLDGTLFVATLAISCDEDLVTTVDEGLCVVSLDLSLVCSRVSLRGQRA